MHQKVKTLPDRLKKNTSRPTANVHVNGKLLFERQKVAEWIEDIGYLYDDESSNATRYEG